MKKMGLLFFILGCTEHTIEPALNAWEVLGLVLGTILTLILTEFLVHKL